MTTQRGLGYACYMRIRPKVKVVRMEGVRPEVEVAKMAKMEGVRPKVKVTPSCNTPSSGFATFSPIKKRWGRRRSIERAWRGGSLEIVNRPRARGADTALTRLYF